jgi:hypothetical protein
MRIRLKGPIELEPASLDDLLKAVDGNRTRIRSLASMILSVCGMLLSSTFVILFFILKEKLPVSYATRVALLATAGCLLASATMGVLSALPPLPVAIYGKIEMIDALMALYGREYRRAIASVVFLFLGLAGFVGALVMFGMASL